MQRDTKNPFFAYRRTSRERFKTLNAWCYVLVAYVAFIPLVDAYLFPYLHGCLAVFGLVFDIAAEYLPFLLNNLAELPVDRAAYVKDMIGLNLVALPVVVLAIILFMRQDIVRYVLFVSAASRVPAALLNYGNGRGGRKINFTYAKRYQGLRRVWVVVGLFAFGMLRPASPHPTGSDKAVSDNHSDAFLMLQGFSAMISALGVVTFFVVAVVAYQRAKHRRARG